MSRTIRRPMPIPSECKGDRCESANCQRCSKDAHFELHGERSDKFSASEINFRKDAGEDRKAHRRNHRRQVSHRVRGFVKDLETWDNEPLALADARRTGGWLTH